MDLLFKRYASPFSILDGYIQTSRLCDFIQVFCKQKAEDDRWEFFMHKVWDKTYPEFCEALQTSQELQNMSEDNIKTTIEKSIDILGNFTPEQGEGER